MSVGGLECAQMFRFLYAFVMKYDGLTLQRLSSRVLQAVMITASVSFPFFSTEHKLRILLI